MDKKILNQEMIVNKYYPDKKQNARIMMFFLIPGTLMFIFWALIEPPWEAEPIIGWFMLGMFLFMIGLPTALTKYQSSNAYMFNKKNFSISQRYVVDIEINQCKVDDISFTEAYLIMNDGQKIQIIDKGIYGKKCDRQQIETKYPIGTKLYIIQIVPKHTTNYYKCDQYQLDDFLCKLVE